MTSITDLLFRTGKITVRQIKADTSVRKTGKNTVSTVAVFNHINDNSFIILQLLVLEGFLSFPYEIIKRMHF